MIKVSRVAFVAALAAGPVTVRPGDSINSAQYTAQDFAAILSAAPANSLFTVPLGPAMTQAAVDAVELRARAGDPVGRFQASQSLMDNGYITDHP